MSAVETIVTVDDLTTAELVREALSEGGIEGIELKPTTGLAYMPRHAAVQYEVRVPIDALDRARRVLADFEEESSQAAMREAESDEALPAPKPRRTDKRLPTAALVVLGFVAWRLLVHLIRR